MTSLAPTIQAHKTSTARSSEPSNATSWLGQGVRRSLCGVADMARLSVDERFVSRVVKSDGCWLWSGRKGTHGYGVFRIKWTDSGVLSHRHAYEVANGPIPDGLCVCHRCDVPLCVNPSHLFLGTSADNNADRVAKGRCAWGDRNAARKHPESICRGEKVGSAVLTNAIVYEIRKRFASGETKRELSQSMGIPYSTVRNVADGKTWKHLRAGDGDSALIE